jgi:hypothetical protein
MQFADLSARRHGDEPARVRGREGAQDLIKKRKRNAIIGSTKRPVVEHDIPLSPCQQVELRRGLQGGRHGLDGKSLRIS